MHDSPGPADAACAGPAATSPEDAIGLQLIRVAKLIRTVRTQAPRAHPAVDGNAYPLLFNLFGGPVRISSLAERAHVEISTVSRAIAGLERAGIIERVPDPDDGRAHLVSLTDAGREALEAIQAQRTAWFTQLLADWSEQDVAQLLHLLTRFGDAAEAYRPKGH
ncbi:MarR family winged helix-turn-helix transcriptional regulator [Nostocoides sp.]|uniref:MarR family winged helix-turn-helix transcriptional regulator n=1 Tax=Nostocoides sp. TaxID=1917966 RepID=UPI002BF628E7|nr:MarR family transcriptional regulator [Tetrasphaera sp.]